MSQSLHWRHNGHISISNHQSHDCLLKRLFRHRSKKTSKLHVIGLCVGNSLGTGEFPTQMASNVENVSIWWRYHAWPYIWVTLIVLVQRCFRCSFGDLLFYFSIEWKINLLSLFTQDTSLQIFVNIRLHYICLGWIKVHLNRCKHQGYCVWGSHLSRVLYA